MVKTNFLKIHTKISTELTVQMNFQHVSTQRKHILFIFADHSSLFIVSRAAWRHITEQCHILRSDSLTQSHWHTTAQRHWPRGWHQLLWAQSPLLPHAFSPLAFLLLFSQWEMRLPKPPNTQNSEHTHTSGISC